MMEKRRAAGAGAPSARSPRMPTRSSTRAAALRESTARRDAVARLAVDQRRRSGRGAGSAGAARSGAGFDASAARADAKRFAVVLQPRRHPAARSVPRARRPGHRRLLVQYLHVLRPLPREVTASKIAGRVPPASSAACCATSARRVSSRSRGIFLGAANALARADGAAAADLRDPARRSRTPRGAGVSRVRRRLHRRRGRPKRTYRLLSHLGLRRVYVGLESGHDPLLAFVKKPGPPRPPSRRSGRSRRQVSRPASS